jgi:hypothetical protein
VRSVNGCQGGVKVYACEKYQGPGAHKFSNHWRPDKAEGIAGLSRHSEVKPGRNLSPIDRVRSNRPFRTSDDCIPAQADKQGVVCVCTGPRTALG